MLGPKLQLADELGKASEHLRLAEVSLVPLDGVTQRPLPHLWEEEGDSGRGLSLCPGPPFVVPGEWAGDRFSGSCGQRCHRIHSRCRAGTQAPSSAPKPGQGCPRMSLFGFSGSC